MAISLIKEFKQKQKISLTPALKKSIDLLQLSRFELIQKIDKEIEINPFVENEEYDEDDLEELSDLNIDDFDFSLEAKATLNENLIDQIDDLNLSKEKYEICLALINSLDESGHLAEDLSEIENILNFNYSSAELENALINIIQK
jgi:RNA polymerase sigma-54 factor